MDIDHVEGAFNLKGANLAAVPADHQEAQDATQDAGGSGVEMAHGGRGNMAECTLRQQPTSGQTDMDATLGIMRRTLARARRTSQTNAVNVGSGSDVDQALDELCQ